MVVRPEDVVFEQQIASHSAAPSVDGAPALESDVKQDEGAAAVEKKLTHAERVAQIDPVGHSRFVYYLNDHARA